MVRRLSGIIVAVIAAVAGVAVFNGALPGLLNSETRAAWPQNDGSDFPAARAQFKTQLTLTSSDKAAAPSPPPAIFRKVTYPLRGLTARRVSHSGSERRAEACGHRLDHRRRLQRARRDVGAGRPQE
jgi:hypothetical protein